MITDNCRLKCDCCGRFVKEFKHTHFIPDSDISIEEIYQLCETCFYKEKNQIAQKTNYDI